MNHRERFNAVFTFKPVDRLPVYFFGMWEETRTRWKNEGLDASVRLEMDPDWEAGMWDCHSMVQPWPLGDIQPAVLEETDSCTVRRDSLGNVVQASKDASSIPHYLEHGLKPTRESWQKFKTFLNPADPRRLAKDWEQKAAALKRRERVATFMGGSLYGWLRDWLGVEALSYLIYDDPLLFEEMVEYLAYFYMALYKPVLQKVDFDFVYFFEDCCYKTGPLFSPNTYKQVYDKYYRKLISFYKGQGIPLALLDSDGNVEKLVPCWLDSGFDIIFPLEVGTWKISPAFYRQRHGRHMRMFGGVDKHVIPQGEAAIRAHLLELKPVVEEGGYIPIPDHRIPPDCSLAQFQVYVQVFNAVFNGGA